MRPAILALAGVVLLVACGGGVRRAPATPPGGGPVVASALPVRDVQRLFEAGQYRQVVQAAAAVAASGATEPVAFLLAGWSAAKLGDVGAARQWLERLAAMGGTPWTFVGRLALGVTTDDVTALADVTDVAESQYPAHPFVLYALGLVYLARGEPERAAPAFDRSLAAAPDFAYAYYHAGLAHYRLRRIDRMTDRFETFIRLAPDAPERPEVEALLRTIRGQSPLR